MAVSKSRKEKGKKHKKKNVFAHIGKLTQIIYFYKINIAENDENAAQTSEMRMIDKNQPSQTK